MEEIENKLENKHPFSMSGREFRGILRRWGYSQREFCDHIGKYRQYFGNKILPRKDVKYKHIAALEEFLGKEDFKVAIDIVKAAREKVSF